MEIITLQIDHLVFGASDMNSATEALEPDFGVHFDVGGEHPVMGTQSAFTAPQLPGGDYDKPSRITVTDKLVFNG